MAVSCVCVIGKCKTFISACTWHIIIQANLQTMDFQLVDSAESFIDVCKINGMETGFFLIYIRIKLIGSITTFRCGTLIKCYECSFTIFHFLTS